MFENRIALTVSDAVSVLLADRQRCRGPEDAEIVIANINRGAGRIRDRIVEPGRQAVALTSPYQVKPEPDSETRVPKFGFATMLTQGAGVCVLGPIDRVFLSIESETAESVEIGQLHEGQRWRRLFVGLFAGRQKAELWSDRHRRSQLLAKCAAGRHQYCSGRGLNDAEFFL